MKNADKLKWSTIIVLLASLLFFVLGFMYPLLQSGYGIGPFTLKKEYIYIGTSFRYFFDQGEIFIGCLLLFFTIVFPAVKYIFLFYTLSERKKTTHKGFSTALEIINKWAMLDVFVVAILILNLKFDTQFIISKLESGTTLFGISVLLMMISSFLTGKMMSPHVVDK